MDQYQIRSWWSHRQGLDGTLTGKSPAVWSSFGIKDKAMESAVAVMEEYIREQLGDAPSFSLDSPKSRAPRIAALKKGAV
jgi:hypothetical protein